MIGIIKVLSGVPRGSHSVPLLFNLFINNIGKCFKHWDYLTADIKLFRCIETEYDQVLLQEGWNILLGWCMFKTGT